MKTTKTTRTNTTDIVTDYFDGGVWCSDSPLTVTYPVGVVLAQDLPNVLFHVSVGASQITDGATTYNLHWPLRDAVVITAA